MKHFKIKNPNSKRQIVRLAPKQKLQLSLSDPNTKVNVVGSFLKNSGIGVTKGERQFIIEPTTDILPYSHLSTHFLGEVIVGVDKSLLVYLEDQDSVRRNVISAVNPFNEELRIRPYEIVEFIYCSDYDNDMGWIWETNICPDTHTGIDLEEIHYSKSISGQDKEETNDLCYAHSRDIFQNGLVIHHFWFRLGKGLIQALEKTCKKDVFVGKLSVEGFDKKQDSSDSCFMDIYCDLLPKYRRQAVDMLTTPLTQQTVATPPRITSRKSWMKQMRVIINRLPTKSMEEGCKIINFKVN